MIMIKNKFKLRDWSRYDLPEQQDYLNEFISDEEYKFHSRSSDGVFIFELVENKQKTTMLND